MSVYLVLFSNTDYCSRHATSQTDSWLKEEESEKVFGQGWLMVDLLLFECHMLPGTDCYRLPD